MSNSNQIDLAWKMVLKLSCMICITSFFCLMTLFMSGIHYWTLGVVFLISLAGSNYVISKFEYIKVHEPAYRQIRHYRYYVCHNLIIHGTTSQKGN